MASKDGTKGQVDGIQVAKALLFMENRDGTPCSGQQYEEFKRTFDYLLAQAMTAGKLPPSLVSRDLDPQNKQWLEAKVIETHPEFDFCVAGWKFDQWLIIVMGNFKTKEERRLKRLVAGGRASTKRARLARPAAGTESGVVGATGVVSNGVNAGEGTRTGLVEATSVQVVAVTNVAPIEGITQGGAASDTVVARSVSKGITIE